LLPLPKYIEYKNFAYVYKQGWGRIANLDVTCQASPQN
jgi:hypothetical protein